MFRQISSAGLYLRIPRGRQVLQETLHSAIEVNISIYSFIAFRILTNQDAATTSTGARLTRTVRPPTGVWGREQTGSAGISTSASPTRRPPPPTVEPTRPASTRWVGPPTPPSPAPATPASPTGPSIQVGEQQPSFSLESFLFRVC